jgi:hypothetical protein
VSVFCENEGRLVTIVIPNRVAEGCRVKVVKCHKTVRDVDCNACQAKRSCVTYLGKQRFSLKAMVKKKQKRKKR